MEGRMDSGIDLMLVNGFYVQCLVVSLIGIASAYFKVPVAYGRYADALKPQGILSIEIPSRVSWVLFESVNLVITAWVIVSQRGDMGFDDVRMIIPALFFTHYIFRVISSGILAKPAKPSTLLFLLSSSIFTSLNSYVQTKYHVVHAPYPPNYVYSPQFRIGFAMFWIGFMINHHSDSVLRNLRKSRQDKNYYIPFGGMFSFVSGANYLGESIEWLGFAILSGTMVGVAFFFSTFFILGARAAAHHNWYLHVFKDKYANLDRSRYIPYLY